MLTIGSIGEVVVATVAKCAGMHAKYSYSKCMCVHACLSMLKSPFINGILNINGSVAVSILAHPYQRAIFDLQEFSKIQSHIVPN